MAEGSTIQIYLELSMDIINQEISKMSLHSTIDVCLLKLQMLLTR